MKLRYVLYVLLSLIAVLGIWFAVFVAVNLYHPPKIIVNNYGAGRLGDQCIGYSKAKYLSYKYHLPFYLIPFPHSDQMMLSQEPHYTSFSYLGYRILYKLFGRFVWVHTEEDLVNGLKAMDRPTRFIAHQNTRLFEHMAIKAGLDSANYAWLASWLYEAVLQFPDFGNELKRKIQPLEPLQALPLPHDRITVAVHIRKGGGYDPGLKAEQYYEHKDDTVMYESFYVYKNPVAELRRIINYMPTYDKVDAAERGPADTVWTDKFPPEQYYAEQICKFSELCNDAPLYVYIFTDDNDVKQLVERIKGSVHKSNIVFAYNLETVQHDTDPLRDCLAMARFDCLIRSGSLLAYIGQVMGNHKVIFYPLHMKWLTRNRLVVDKVGIIFQKPCSAMR